MGRGLGWGCGSGTASRGAGVGGRSHRPRGLESAPGPPLARPLDCRWAQRKEEGGRMAAEPWKLCWVDK